MKIHFLIETQKCFCQARSRKLSRFDRGALTRFSIYARIVCYLYAYTFISNLSISECNCNLRLEKSVSKTLEQPILTRTLNCRFLKYAYSNSFPCFSTSKDGIGRLFSKQQLKGGAGSKTSKKDVCMHCGLKLTVKDKRNSGFTARYVKG